MNIQEVQKEIDHIKRVSDDDEVAHGCEDDLHCRVLQAIADGVCDDPVGCARLALTTADIDFARWCA